VGIEDQTRGGSDAAQQPLQDGPVPFARGCDEGKRRRAVELLETEEFGLPVATPSSPHESTS